MSDLSTNPLVRDLKSGPKAQWREAKLDMTPWAAREMLEMLNIQPHTLYDTTQ